ncbi:MAG TPA: PH domain-containing protein [Intrasporangium sp.]|uniref:PH domain-containing protein n=1 Tax=Intrasporangium sp. TaxID=1925024 RepID=UPI002D7662F1|nr:PH domain-containing protein [Intrasporangium sp.]HET7397166.1 PH domain-containing protein [Intrasporangium sp.]
MGFPENVLAEGERVEQDIHPHWMTVLVPTFVGVLLVAGAVVAAWITPDDETGNRFQWVLVAVLVLLSVPFVIVPYLRWRTTHYVITTHRVMVRRGILGKSGKDVTLSKITDVSFEQSLLDRIINAGSLRIESAGDSPDELLRNIPHSNHVQQVINRLVDQDDERRRMVTQARQARRRGADGASAAGPDGAAGAGPEGAAGAGPEGVPGP